MPTFTAIALDRLLEPGASKSAARAAPNTNGVSDSSTSRSTKSGRPPRLERSGIRSTGSGSNSSTEKKRFHRAQITPALYATPEATPLPDSPSSFPPSPYIINHKRRGPRLLKSASQESVPTQLLAEQGLGGEKAVGDEGEGETKVLASAASLPVAFTAPSPIKNEELVDGVNEETVESSGCVNGSAGTEDLGKFVDASPERDSESSAYFDPHESMSFASNTDGEDNGALERSFNNNVSNGEFFDACEELSSEGGSHASHRDFEAELREIRLSLLMEIEKRKQAEESMKNTQNQWRRIVGHLSDVGLTLPTELPNLEEDEQSSAKIAEQLCRQVYLARFVSESIGRGAAKAEAEVEMEVQIEAKNFEISRLWDKLHYYEAMNREMSQRNQETVEMARRERQKRKRRQKWYWGLVAAAITIGAGTLVWSYLPSGKGSTSSSESHGLEENDAPK